MFLQKSQTQNQYASIFSVTQLLGFRSSRSSLSGNSSELQNVDQSTSDSFSDEWPHVLVEIISAREEIVFLFLILSSR